ncbi:hypothetical protein P3T76_005998 [Phytophthora citrophthora]|uniref:Uncharacterized protein n=1 Tax=Phytophthora citrophthora TaxID=4793 RepID=A0AAD9GQ19_9STRA|nr:hypothetical protein P3T76_005998 [Phytophthora citrophthora]
MGTMEKQSLLNPFELRGPNKEVYRCEVKPTPATATMPAGLTIYLINERTNDKWSCCVTSSNIDSFRSKKTNELRLGGLNLVVLAVLQELLRGTIGPLTSSYVPTQDWCTLSLKAKHSHYFMKLTLDCQLGGNRGSWCFPMNPEDPGAIKNRERGAITP